VGQMKLALLELKGMDADEGSTGSRITNDWWAFVSVEKYNPDRIIVETRYRLSIHTVRCFCMLFLILFYQRISVSR
jgi:hypothetical protein